MSEDKVRRAARTLIQAAWAGLVSLAGALGVESLSGATVPGELYALAVPILAGLLSGLANDLESREGWLSYVGKVLVLWVNKGTPLPRNEDGTFRSPG